MKLTISIVIVITLYLIGELPAHMTSRKSSLNLIFGGDTNKVDESFMERVEVICITLNALQLSLNIVVYAVINPSFMPEFFLLLKGTSDVCIGLCCFRAVVRGGSAAWSGGSSRPRQRSGWSAVWRPSICRRTRPCPVAARAGPVTRAARTMPTAR